MDVQHLEWAEEEEEEPDDVMGGSKVAQCINLTPTWLEQHSTQKKKGKWIPLVSSFRYIELA